MFIKNLNFLRKFLATMIMLAFTIVQMVPPAQAASGITLKSYNYPVKISVNSNFTVRGVIKSSAKLTSVTVGVFTASGSRKTGRTLPPKAKSFNIYTVHKDVNFKSLKKGIYYYKIICSTAKVKNKVILSKKFTVE